MKKKLPISLLEKIQPLIKKTQSLAKIVNDDKFALHLVDNDEFNKSDFYFRIAYISQRGDYNVNMRPGSMNTTQPIDWGGVSIEKVEEYLVNWLDILQRYRDVNTIYDNPAKHQAQYFYEEFKIMDEDADVAPFNPNQVILLNANIENYKTRLLSLKQDDNEEAIDAIIEDCEKLQDNIYSEPKNKVMDGLAKIWGKTVTTLKKEGKGFIKEYWEEFKKDIIGKLTKYITEGGAVAAVIEGVKHVL